MFQKKENNLTKEHWIDIQNCSNEELQSRNAQDIESASSNLEGVPSRIKGEITYAHPPGGFLRAPVYQNWVVIRQNELLSRQNEQIINQNAGIAHQNQQIIRQNEELAELLKANISD